MIDPPRVELWAILPVLILFGGAVIALVGAAFARRADQAPFALLTLAALAAAAASALWLWQREPTTALEGMVSVDRLAVVATLTLCGVGAFGAYLGYHYFERDELRRNEFYALLLFALGGMALLVAAADLIVVFLAIEVLSLSLYVLTALTFRRGPTEASLKYFLLGAFSSAFLLYGIALGYGATGTTNLLGIARASGDPTGDGTLLLAGVGLLAVGFCFKVSAVPFHMWTPDVYQGTPTPVAAFMAAATKVAGFAVFLRVFAGALGGLVVTWRPAIAAIAVVTMLVGAALAVVQTDLKRMLAYSSISHAGYLLVGVAAAATVPAGVSASMFYLLVYAFMVMGAFMVVPYVSRLGPADDEAIRERSSLEDYRGLARRHPWAAGLLAVFMLALTGIPPLSGFWAKYYVFLAGIEAGLTWLVVVAVISSAISAFFYLRVLVVAYLQEPVGDAEAETSPGPTRALGLALGLAGLLTVAIGLAPEALISAARSAERILG